MKNKGMLLGAVLAAVLLVSMAFVPGAIAQYGDDKAKSNKDIVILNKEVKEDIDDKYLVGKDDGQLLKYSPPGDQVSAMGTLEWSAYTDLYNVFLSPAPRLNTYSKSRDDSSPWDIDKIEVRGRVWKGSDLTFDQTVSNSNSADASIYWKSGCTYCAGSYSARGNHVFEKAGYQSWYPITEDTLSV